MERTIQDAVEAAIRWRDAKHLALHGTPVPVRAFHEIQANSTSGIVGVRERIKVVKKKLASGYTRLYEVPVVIVEVWLEPGRNERRLHKSRSKLFSTAKHGRTLVLEMATAWRSEQVAVLRQAHKHSPINPDNGAVNSVAATPTCKLPF